MQFELKPHQKLATDRAKEILKQLGLVYIFGQPRVGKSLISLETERQLKASLKTGGRLIVFTKKAAISDWLKYKEQYDFDIVNYEQVGKFDKKLYNFVIIDEAHNFGAFPKPSQRTKKFREFCVGKPIIFLSGTPLVESINAIYSQLSLSSFSPFREFKNGYTFHKVYGEPSITWLYGRQMESYKKGKIDEIMSKVNPYVVRVTYEDAGFDYQNHDEIIDISSPELERLMRGICKTWIACESYTEKKEISFTKSISRFMQPSSKTKVYPLENVSSQCQAMHQFTGGFYKDLNLPQPKLDWLKKFIASKGKDKIAIMCYFIEEQEKLRSIFKDKENISVLSATKYCEGIDLSHFDHYILYSFGYSGSKFIQLRDRIVNLDKHRITKVIIPLLRNCLDYDIYRSVSAKKTFNTTMCRRNYAD